MYGKLYGMDLYGKLWINLPGDIDFVFTDFIEFEKLC